MNCLSQDHESLGLREVPPFQQNPSRELKKSGKKKLIFARRGTDFAEKEGMLVVYRILNVGEKQKQRFKGAEVVW